MPMHDVFIQWVLGPTASILLAAFAFVLMSIYILQIFLTVGTFVINKGVRKNRLILRAINWGVFGGVFLLFGEVVALRDLATWRATARVALFFLMLPEMAYQLTVLWPTIRRRLRDLWTKILHQSS